ncbi:stage III sporulation protein AC [Clostridium botulinum]|uniref:Stage III sporulation protein AC, SpoIIIAC-related protein n=9 Tax=Clostridium TaxID=1485 RepID=A0Q092_CLONN|nr:MULTISPECIES: stage III sporulation protein AC [Clostridium]EDS77959.1 stage III sporulation protein AC [Clostridium botulinum C str. Eklund]EGO86594.1 stage III sporulation protein AC [Clostridium botulinum C str. Stockholm]KEH95919.1 stage III sporulation protein AC [Clostridium botulinum C/D str. BKT12695]ABK61191.1 stage III sporulation protein AC, SpoIIIAC -related protein [Clostridium novyi NT]AYF54945.1 stage III sporulation protein AC [Clostridium novyi]
MLDVSLIFKIAAVSILIIILDKILESTGKKDYAVIANLAGIIIVLMMVINLINKLFSTVKTMFQF